MIEEYYDLYRMESTGGKGTKDWAIKVSGTGKVTVKFGKTGSKLATQEIPSTTPDSFKRDKIQEKTGKGYELIGRFKISDTGKLTAINNDENQTWNLNKTKSGLVLDCLKQFAKDINEFEFEFQSLEAEYSQGETGVIFRCDGYLPNRGWTLAINKGLSYLSNGHVVGGGRIDHPMQTLILAALANRLDEGELTAVSSKGANSEKSLMPSKKGLPDDFVQSLSLPVDLVREVAMATGLMPKPVALFKKGFEPMGTNIYF
jgi:hypothetical protein